MVSKRLDAWIEEQCLDRAIPLRQAHLRELIREDMAQSRMERPQQGRDGQLIQPTDCHGADGPLVRRERLGG